MQGIRKGEEREVVRETAHTRWTEGRLPLARARAFRVSCPSRIPFSFKRLPFRLAIDLFTVFFFTFDVDKLGKIRRYQWKDRLDINKIAKFQSDTSPQSCEKRCRKISRLWSRTYIFVSFQQLTFRLGNFSNLKALFSMMFADFP